MAGVGRQVLQLKALFTHSFLAAFRHKDAQSNSSNLVSLGFYMENLQLLLLPALFISVNQGAEGYMKGSGRQLRP